jgi:hypothetical protein
MWAGLNQSDKEKYKEYCDSNYGKSIVKSEIGEPLYFDKQGFKVSYVEVFKLLNISLN